MCLAIVENVYPIRFINTELPRRKIHMCSIYTVKAKGMDMGDMVNYPIIPTPGAVMEAAKLLYDDIAI